MKVALVYDRVNKWGGAERVLLALHEIWPEAPLYTSVYDPKGAPWASVFDVRTTFLQYIPLAKSHHELFPWLMQMAFETLNFDEFDVVISVTSAEAKGIITKPGTLHICYCLTPTRYLWSGYDDYQSRPGLGMVSNIGSWIHKITTPVLRRWDMFASVRPDKYIAISERVSARIKKYYKRDVDEVIYPPVDTTKFKVQSSKFKVKDEEYYLLVSRLVGYKRVDIVIEAFNILELPLVVIGDGNEREELMRQSNNTITFITRRLTDTELARYYQRCRAFVFAGDEDFGIVAVEAQSCGKPVIAYRQSGISEIIQDKTTGILYDEQSSQALIEAVSRFEHMKFDANACRTNAERFDKRIFQALFLRLIQKLYTEYRNL